MAFSAKILCSLFLCFYIISLQVHAREGLFFSKVSHSNTNNNNIEAEAGLPTTEVTSLPTTEVNVTSQDDESQPTFTPEGHNGYGLYGREMDQGSANLPEKTSTEAYNGGENSEFMFNNGVPFDSKNKDNNVVYEAKQYGLSDTRYQDNGNNNNNYNTNNYDENKQNSFNGNNNNNYNANNYDENKQNSFNGNNNNNYNANNYDENKQNSFNGNNNNNYNANNYDENKQNSFNGNNNNNYNANNNYGYENKQNSFNGNNGNYNRYQYPAQKQGMSDTRYFENGKYFYDLNNEELYKNRYQYQTVRRRKDDVLGSSSSRGVNSRNQYSQEGSLDENLSKFNNMEDNQNNQEEYVP
ncbi:hypothetical protein FRX31_004246 [Thalictrum thalictroides]|uniref:Uncharacterized protein n=1 Tax=Thalictrum thalictroides TaxID=46969 RepID=A0A7J6X8P1_THATH|nr:hypothetical protein FRX31_004246 [Thalictrum thalictroides]